MIDYIVDLLLSTYIRYEEEKVERKSRRTRKAILPNYVIKRRIKIYNNGVIVFDSEKVDEIPEDIQYTIKSYGIPKNIKPNNKTPLIYNINTTLSSIFENEEMEDRCMKSIRHTVI